MTEELDRREDGDSYDWGAPIPQQPTTAVIEAVDGSTRVTKYLTWPGWVPKDEVMECIGIWETYLLKQVPGGEVSWHIVWSDDVE